MSHRVAEDDISSQPNRRERVHQARESSADRHRGEIQLACLRNIKKNCYLEENEKPYDLLRERTYRLYKLRYSLKNIKNKSLSEKNMT